MSYDKQMNDLNNRERSLENIVGKHERQSIPDLNKRIDKVNSDLSNANKQIKAQLDAQSSAIRRLEDKVAQLERRVH